jgi:hypothetical protein
MPRASQNILLLACLCAGVLALPARGAQTLYDNYSEDPDSPLNPYADPAFGYQISWTLATHWSEDVIAAQGASYAMPFVNTLSDETAVNTVSLAVYKQPDGEAYDNFGDSLATNHDNLTILLADSNDDGTLPGETLETLAVNPLITPGAANFLELPSSAHTVLKPGQTYWIILQPTTISPTSTDADTFYYWVQSKTDLSYDDYLNLYAPFVSGDWLGFEPQGDGPQLAPSLRVTVDVPEPATLSLLLLPALCLAIRRASGTQRHLRRI